jgi:primosomal protein N' (replication factor Y)
MLNSIIDNITQNKFGVFLLHDIAGDLRSEFYIQAISHAKDLGKSSIVLVPQVSLISQILERLNEKFRDDCAVFHSQLPSCQSLYEWKRIRNGIAKIVVGVRSSIFLTPKNLGLVIVDEEQESSYKQESAPRYNARDVAIMRAKLENLTAILGSTAPSLESYYNAKKKKFKLICLRDEIPRPEVKVVDMRQEFPLKKRLFSKILENEINETLKKDEQAILFLNRRGFSTSVSCQRCGFVLKCQNCNIVLSFHFDRRKLICHYCNYRTMPPEVCPNCQGSYLRYYGRGTQKVESEAARIFPTAKIGRLDVDVISNKANFEKIVSDFKEKKLNLIIGTQIIAKLIEFSKVGLVGVISADPMLNLPDFRAGEKVFSILTQLINKAKRDTFPGKVIIQTYAPNNYTILTASQGDYEKFYTEEIKLRRELGFPPITHIVSITLRGKKEEKVKDAAKILTKRIKLKNKKIALFGPAPAILSKVRGNFRWNIILKARRREEICATLRPIFRRIKKPSGVIIVVDVDPV